MEWAQQPVRSAWAHSGNDRLLKRSPPTRAPHIRARRPVRQRVVAQAAAGPLTGVQRRPEVPVHHQEVGRLLQQSRGRGGREGAPGPREGGCGCGRVTLHSSQDGPIRPGEWGVLTALPTSLQGQDLDKEKVGDTSKTKAGLARHLGTSLHLGCRTAAHLEHLAYFLRPHDRYGCTLAREQAGPASLLKTEPLTQGQNGVFPALAALRHGSWRRAGLWEL